MVHQPAEADFVVAADPAALRSEDAEVSVTEDEEDHREEVA